MNRLAHWMMRLYPSRWRRRYGDELDALLADTGADVGVVADLAKGGIRMQFSTWSFAKLAVVLGFGGLLLGAAGSFLIAPMYVSKATVRVEPLAEVMQQVEPLVLSRTSLGAVIQDPRHPLYKEPLKTRPFQDVIEEMRNDIRIDTVPNASAFTISFQYPDPAMAQQTVGALIARFDEEAGRLERAQPQAGGKHLIDVVDRASLPVLPVWPNQRLVELAGCLVGLSIPLLWRRLRRKRVLTRGLAIFVPLCGLAGMLAGDTISILDHNLHLLHNQYRSSSMMSIQNGTPERIRALANSAISRTSLSTVITDPRMRLYQEQLNKLPLEDVIQNMQKHLSIAESGSGGHYFTVSFEYGDRYKAQQTVMEIMNRIDQEYVQMYGELPDERITTGTWGKFEVLNQPSIPVLPVSPDRYKIAGECGFAGLYAAAIIALIRRRWRPQGDIPVDAVNG